jgi:hypothetical protein
MLSLDLVSDKQKEYRKDSDIFFNQYVNRRNKSVNFAEQIGKQ